MTGPFYVSPEQQMKDRADFARKGIARGRAVVVLRYRDGICFVAENPSATLHKVSEVYDRIGFAAVGRYHEFETLRVAGIQQADVRGFTYDRSDVSARTLVNAYAQWLGTVFASVAEKPFEVELALAEVADHPAADRVYRITYDGSVFDERTFCAMGGSSEAIADVALHHHERLDGSGYPDGLKGNQICLEARIVAVADVVEAIASHRPYRPALGLDAAVAELREHRGTRYDPAVVDACTRLIESGELVLA